MPRTIRDGNGGRAAFERLGGTRELPLLAGHRPIVGNFGLGNGGGTTQTD
jgi:hypothetical protein